MKYELPPELSVSAEGAVRVVTISRPDELNAVNQPLHWALANVWRQLAADLEAKVVILTGAGRAFSAGGDLDWITAFLDDPRTRLAYAVAITVDGSPQFFYADLFENIPPWQDYTTADAIPSRAWIENLLWCHQKLAFKSRDYFVRYQGSEQLLILERGARAGSSHKISEMSLHLALKAAARAAHAGSSRSR